MYGTSKRGKNVKRLDSNDYGDRVHPTLRNFSIKNYFYVWCKNIEPNRLLSLLTFYLMSRTIDTCIKPVRFVASASSTYVDRKRSVARGRQPLRRGVRDSAGAATMLVCRFNITFFFSFAIRQCFSVSFNIDHS